MLQRYHLFLILFTLDLDDTNQINFVLIFLLVSESALSYYDIILIANRVYLFLQLLLTDLHISLLKLSPTIQNCVLVSFLIQSSQIYLKTPKMLEEAGCFTLSLSILQYLFRILLHLDLVLYSLLLGDVLFLEIVRHWFFDLLSFDNLNLFFAPQKLIYTKLFFSVTTYSRLFFEDNHKFHKNKQKFFLKLSFL